jgi:hypothetical protein
MIEIPPSIVANWPSPDPTHPETKGPALPIVVLLLYFTTAFILGVRLWGKTKTSNGLCIEDRLVGIAMVGFNFGNTGNYARVVLTLPKRSQLQV